MEDLDLNSLKKQNKMNSQRGLGFWIVWVLTKVLEMGEDLYDGWKS